MSTMFANTPEEKLRFAFEICDGKCRNAQYHRSCCWLLCSDIAGYMRQLQRYDLFIPAADYTGNFTTHPWNYIYSYEVGQGTNPFCNTPYATLRG